MGTDIHTVVQVFEEGEWITVATGVYTYRCHTLFCILGVSSKYGPPGISEVKGLPEDFAFNEDTQEHRGYWMGSWGYSWYLLSDLCDYMKKNPNAEELSELIEIIEKEVMQTVKAPHEIRFVFGFDN